MASPAIGRVDVVAFPAPGLDSRILRVLRDPGTAEYELFAEGTPIEECSFIRGADLESLPSGYFLAKVVPQPNSGLEEWYFLNQRSNEDEYNFEVNYEAEDKEYPIVTRSYVTLRRDYEALAFTETDPKNPELRLVAQKQVRVEDPIVDSLFVAVQRVFQRVPGKVLTGKVITQEGQVGTLTRQVVAPGTDLTASALTVSGSVQPDNGGRSVLEKVEIDQVFDDKRVAKEKPDLVPQEFRGAVPTETVEVTEPGADVSMPSLASGELAKSEQRLSEHKIRKTAVSRPSTALPATLVDTLVDNDGVLVSRNKTLASNPQTITPSATVSGQVENLGDGLTLKTEDTKAEVFPAKTFAIEKPDNVPLEFRAEKPSEVEEITEEGQVAPVSLAGDEIAKSEQQLTKFTKRVRTTKRDLTTSAVLEGEQIDQDGVKVTVRRTLAQGSQSVAPSATVSGQVDDIGDGKTIKTELTRAEVFPGKVFASEAPDPAPAKFRVAVPAVTTEETVTGDAAAPELETGDLAKSEQQLTKFTKRTRKTSRSPGSLPKSLTQTTTTNELQKAVVTETLQTGDTSEQPSATTTIESEALGDGNYVVRKTEVPEVFPAKTFAIEKPDNVPLEFRAEKPSEVEEITEEGQVAPVSLAGDEIAKSEQQLTKFTKRVRTISRDASSYPTLSGQDYDDTLDVEIPYTKKIVDIGGPFVPGADISPISNTQAVETLYDLESIRSNIKDLHYIFPTQERVSLPDKLLSAKVILTRTYGDSNAISYGSNASFQMGSSAGVAGDMVLDIEKGYEGPVPAEVHIFFLDVGAGSNDIISKVNAQLWPAIKPRNHTVIISGKRLTKEYSESMSDQGGSLADSVSATPVITTVNIPPTIHTAITIDVEYINVQAPRSSLDAYIDNWTAAVQAAIAAAVEAGAVIEGSIEYQTLNRTVNFIDDFDQLEGTISPGTLEATTPDSFPAGKFIVSSDVTPYRFGLAKVTAVVVDVSDYV